MSYYINDSKHWKYQMDKCAAMTANLHNVEMVTHLLELVAVYRSLIEYAEDHAEYGYSEELIQPHVEVNIPIPRVGKLQSVPREAPVDLGLAGAELHP